MNKARHHVFFVKSAVLQKDSTIADTVRDEVLNRFGRSRSYLYMEMPEYMMLILYLPTLNYCRRYI